MTNKLFSSSHKGLLGPVQKMQEATQELEGSSMAGERTMGEQWGSGCAPQCHCNCSRPCCLHCSSVRSWSPAHPNTSWDHISITTFDQRKFVWPPPKFAQSPLLLCPATVCGKSRRQLQLWSKTGRRNSLASFRRNAQSMLSSGLHLPPSHQFLGNTEVIPVSI